MYKRAHGGAEKCCFSSGIYSSNLSREGWRLKALFLTQNPLVWAATSANHLGWIDSFAFWSDVTLPPCYSRACRGVFWLTCLFPDHIKEAQQEDLSRRRRFRSGRQVGVEECGGGHLLWLNPGYEIKACVLLHLKVCCCFEIQQSLSWRFRCQESCALLEWFDPYASF